MLRFPDTSTVFLYLTGWLPPSQRASKRDHPQEVPTPAALPLFPLCQGALGWPNSCGEDARSHWAARALSPHLICAPCAPNQAASPPCTSLLPREEEEGGLKHPKFRGSPQQPQPSFPEQPCGQGDTAVAWGQAGLGTSWVAISSCQAPKAHLFVRVCVYYVINMYKSPLLGWVGGAEGRCSCVHALSIPSPSRDGFFFF